MLSRRKSEQANKAMWDELNTLDAAQITRVAIENENKHHAEEMMQFAADVAKIERTKVAA